MGITSAIVLYVVIWFLTFFVSLGLQPSMILLPGRQNGIGSQPSLMLLPGCFHPR